jgi:endonuclease III related protein
MVASTSTDPVAGSGETSSLLLQVYRRLLDHYGPQHWWPAETALEVIVGAILAQSAAWMNVERAVGRLKEAGILTVEGLRAIDESDLAALIRPAGYFNAKARKLKALVSMIDRSYGRSLDTLLRDDVETLRCRLLETYGIGRETADAIVLYAAGRPSFVVDAYTRRVFSRVGLIPPGDDYESWRSLFMQHLPADATLMNEYHALLVEHAKRVCLKREPLCGSCVIQSSCKFGQARAADRD